MRALTPEQRQALLLQLLQQLLTGAIHEGELLRTLRKKVLGMSQQEYASLVGISRRSLSDLERNTASPSIALLARVFKPLGLKPALLPRSPHLLAQLLNPSALADQIGGPSAD